MTDWWLEKMAQAFCFALMLLGTVTVQIILALVALFVLLSVIKVYQ